MVEGGMKCVKYLLFLFNLIFFLAGLGLIIAGAVVQTKFKTYFDFFGSTFSGVAILLIVVGAIVFIIGFFGCCGAYKENYCMVMTFAVLLAIIFILEIAAGITAYVMRDQVQNLATKALDRTQKMYGNGTASDRAWDVMQQDFECCGVHNYTDWSNNNILNPADVPDSCCSKANNTNVKDCGKGQRTTPTHINKQGCVSQIVSWVEDNILIIGAVGIGLAFVQIFGITIACCLAAEIKKGYQEV